MSNVISKYTTVRVSTDIYNRLISHLDYKVIIGRWVDEAISEKMEKEKKKTNS